jgi:hypothetical protein
MTNTINEQAGTMSMTLDFDGNVFNMGDPPPSVFTGTIGAGTFTVSGTSATFGTVTITGNGAAFTGTSTNIPGGVITSAQFTDGLVSTSQITFKYRLFIGATEFANGTVTLNKQ